MDSPLVSFSDSIGAGLQLGNFVPQNVSGNGLLVHSDDPSALLMNFTQLNGSLSLVFGNDDPFIVGSNNSTGSIAQLTLFNGATQVGQVSVVMNGNDIADQTISYTGTAFNNASFVYANAAGIPISLIELVDDINFERANPTNPVPAPAGLVLGFIGMGFAGLTRRLWTKKA